MKYLFAVVRSLAPVMLLLIGLSATAGGGTGSQGPRFLGLGLDEPVVPPGASGGISYAGEVQVFTLDTNQRFPPASEAAMTTPPGQKFVLTNLKCDDPPSINASLTKCAANVRVLAPDPGPVCKEGDPEHNPVRLLALNAGWDVQNARPNFGLKTSVVFACEDPSPGTEDPPDAIGAIGKCVGARYFDHDTERDQEALVACIHAMRADYCGNGWSFTRKGTPIISYNFFNPVPSDRTICATGKCYEGSWDKDGAVCLNHARYEYLVKLSSNKKLNSLDKVKGGRGMNRRTPMIDGLKCSGQWEPLASCVNEFTDFYFDDQHAIGRAGEVSTVDAVTSQFVCKRKKRRWPSALVTRTKVRFPLANGGVDDLECCDTLACPK